MCVIGAARLALVLSFLSLELSFPEVRKAWLVLFIIIEVVISTMPGSVSSTNLQNCSAFYGGGGGGGGASARRWVAIMRGQLKAVTVFTYQAHVYSYIYPQFVSN